MSGKTLLERAFRAATPRVRTAPGSARRAVALRVGMTLGRASSALLRSLTRDFISVPTQREVGGVVVDVATDLVAYTQLSPDRVDALLRRRLDTFRVEWHLLPDELRVDHWFYLSSRMYLFGNAVHTFRDGELTAIRELAGKGVVLDFGGGSGNLALGLAALGARVDYLEVSALQKDFARFRVQRHGLEERVRVLDAWQPLGSAQYAVVCAFDVFEHLPALEQTLRERVLPSLAPGGAVIERSPFGATYENPMEHDDAGLEGVFASVGFVREHRIGGANVWRQRTAP